MRRALCPTEAVPAAHPLSQEPSTGTDHHPQLWSGLDLEPDERGSAPPACFQNRAAAQKAQSEINSISKRGCGKFTGERRMALSISLKPTRCVVSQIFSSHPGRRCGFMFTPGMCPSTFLAWVLNHLSERNSICVIISNNLSWSFRLASLSERPVHLSEKQRNIHLNMFVQLKFSEISLNHSTSSSLL